MALSTLQLRWLVLVTTLKTTLTHVFSRKYPSDWSLSFHIQFAILKRLKEVMNTWTMEEVKTFSVKYLPEHKNGWIFPLTICIDAQNDPNTKKELYAVLKKLSPGYEIPEVELQQVTAEWQGAGTVSPESLSNFSGPVVLHLHGGGYITGSATAERTATLKLADLTGAQILAVNYRLAPQNVFPAALLDAIIAYKFLVQPPSSASHAAVDPKKLIIAGDSAGGGLVMSLMTFLANTDILPKPAGVIAISPLLDVTGSFLSPNSPGNRLDWLVSHRTKPFIPKPSALWPSSKPRWGFYTDIPLHPLVSPVLATGCLSGSPPIFIVIGDVELLRDEAIWFATTYTKRGGNVFIQNYRSMPHVFLLFESHPSTKTCYEQVSRFVLDVIAGREIQTKMEVVNGLGEVEEDMVDWGELTVEMEENEVCIILVAIPANHLVIEGMKVVEQEKRDRLLGKTVA